MDTNMETQQHYFHLPALSASFLRAFEAAYKNGQAKDFSITPKEDTDATIFGSHFHSLLEHGDDYLEYLNSIIWEGLTVTSPKESELKFYEEYVKPMIDYPESAKVDHVFLNLFCNDVKNNADTRKYVEQFTTEGMVDSKLYDKIKKQYDDWMKKLEDYFEFVDKSRNSISQEEYDKLNVMYHSLKENDIYSSWVENYIGLAELEIEFEFPVYSQIDSSIEATYAVKGLIDKVFINPKDKHIIMIDFKTFGDHTSYSKNYKKYATYRQMALYKYGLIQNLMNEYPDAAEWQFDTYIFAFNKEYGNLKLYKVSENDLDVFHFDMIMKPFGNYQDFSKNIISALVYRNEDLENIFETVYMTDIEEYVVYSVKTLIYLYHEHNQYNSANVYRRL